MRKVRYRVANVDELAPDVGKLVTLGGDGGECLVIQHEGRFFAVGSVCPHQNAPFDGSCAKQGSITCRRHAYRFDLTTGDCLTVGGYGLPVYETDIADNSLYVSFWEYD